MNLVAATGMSPALAGRWQKPLEAAMARFGINTPARQAHFLGQAGHESNGFTALVENLNYSAQGLANTWPSRFKGADGQPNAKALQIARQQPAIAAAVYDGRLGNDKPGDGWRYRGRGLFQLTGKANYRDAGVALGLDLVGQPELLEEPEAAALTAAWYWSKHGLNAAADRGDLLAVTKTINGGTIGLDDRRKRTERATQALA